ncbi:Calx-beta domain-containing protein [Aestuariivivens insulae]|uniref:Calx-beta domain-containing protein n=1 Tax=Aestuariivivens insulae TaxID=1621988 RepID=UPI001F57D188|nr:Calx-beta domain-containing protein [Aestuariivivens insulae]
MKKLKYLFILVLALSFLGCEETPELYDFERYKFVSFISEEESVMENAGDHDIFLRYDGSTLEEDFTVTLSVGGTAQEGTDYNVESKTVVFKAGEIKSEPFTIDVIDNLLDGTEDLTMEITIESVSNPNIDIGLGIVNQSNKIEVVTILDNECSEDIDIFATDLNCATPWTPHTVTGTIDGSVLTLSGNLVDYSPLSVANLEVNLTPVEAGAKIGSASFNDYYVGLVSDGYVYQFRQAGEGTYDVCNKTITISIEVYWESGGSWAYWYTSDNIITIP